MPVFPKKFAQYEHAEISLNRYVDQYEDDPEWQLSYSVRKDVMQRARSGLKVRKKVHIRKVKKIEVTRHQVDALLLQLHRRRPYNQMSFDILEAIQSMIGGFNTGSIALLAFGPSEKTYEKGKHEQNVKIKIKRMVDENLLELSKNKYHKMPVWDIFYNALMELKESGIYILQMGEDLF